MKSQLNVMLILLISVTSTTLLSQENEHRIEAASKFHEPFVNKNPNRKLSPYTGLDRNGWLACGRHILEGAFSHVEDMNDPMFLPKQPGPGYPRNNETASRQQRSAAIFEAIARSFNIAAPLIQENPDVTINGIRLQEYYKYHLLQLMTNPESDYFIGHASDYKKQTQQTCELGNLCLWMIIAPEVFWDILNQDEKAAVAKVISEWAVSHTLPHNWRWFNVMMSTFLAKNGYDYNRDIMLNHLDHLLLQYAGDGWYRDTSYDYYTCHVFQLYGAVWTREYGRKYAPARAKILDRHFNEFSHHYPQIFSRDGHIIMYGRSILYRLGASAGMAATQLRDKPCETISPGLARRVASGALLQFTTHPVFFHQGIPSLGFYGPFPPAIQSYSCSASPFWMFMNFTSLTLPEDHPFWTTKEQLGHWEKLSADKIYNDYWEGPGFLITNHGNTGASEIRPSKIHTTNPNYSRMVYNSAFPWEADGNNGIIAGAITLKRGDGKPALPRIINASGFRDGVLYRQAEFSGHLPPSIDMATIMIPGGEIRIDRVRRMHPCTVKLGHFGLPHMKQKATIKQGEINGKSYIQASIPGRQLAMTLYNGWGNVETIIRKKLNPEADESTLIYATMKDRERFGPVQLLVSVLLHKTDDTLWTDKELYPIASIKPLVEASPMALSGMVIKLHNGKEYKVDFQDMDGTNSTW